MLGLSFPLFLVGIGYNHQALTGRRLPLLIIMTTIAILSITAHKEDRFLLPLVSLATIYCGRVCDGWAKTKHGSKLLYCLVAAQFLGGLYLCQWHQSSQSTLLTLLRQM